MTRKTRFSHVFKKPSSLLIFLGKPLFKLLTLCLISALLLSTLFNQIKTIARFKRLKISRPKITKPAIRVSPYALLGVPVAMLITGSIMLYQNTQSFLSELPDVATLPTYKNYASTKMYDRDGRLMYKFYEDVNRTPVSLSEIPLTVKLATIAAEDQDFYIHKGVSLRAIGRAIYKYLQGGRLTGASTITQQLVKNVYLSPERTIDRKIREMVLALQIEQMYTKDQILEFYLNRVPYGGTAYGIQEAAHAYFGKDIQEVNLPEAVFLASLPQNPNSTPRLDRVLTQMEELEFISSKEKADALSHTLPFKKDPLFTVAPHFTMYVRDQIIRKYGASALLTGGLTVTTTLNQDIQHMAEKAVETELAKLKKLHVTNAGAIVVSVKTGEILAMVGSRNYNDFENDGNVNTTLALRQPGSSIKVVNYAHALSHGYTPASILDDTPITFNIKGSRPYTPKNYDGTYKGRMTLRDALAQSRNIPAVKILHGYGVAQMVELGQKMGITSWDNPSRFGLSLTLGGGEVPLIDLASVYNVIANLGTRVPLVSVQTISDLKGKKVNAPCHTDVCVREQVIDPRVAYQLIDILADNRARTPAFGANSALVIPNHPEVAVKTGTSNNLRDNLTVGFNQEYLVAVWVGNGDGSAMSRVASGVTGASPIWNSIMKELLKEKSSVAWNAPSGLIQIALCGGKKEWFLTESTPKVTCSSDVARSNDQIIFN